MVLALYGGLARLGVPLPQLARLESLHGPLMVCGVFGTLISLERAVAIGLAWPYTAPACFGLGALLMVSGLSVGAAATLTVVAAAVFLAASIWIVFRQPALFTAVLLVGAAMLFIGCSLWLSGVEVRALVAWWLGFLVCTIGAERLELSRIMQPGTASKWIFSGVVTLILIGAALGLDDELGGRVLGVGFLGTALWLARHDVATRTIRMSGQSRFMAAAMLAGYLWVAVSGLALLLIPGAAFAYDLTLHALVIGFVLSMVFGHALIIFPAVTGVAVRYRPALYLPLALLHVSVLVRVLGDLFELWDVRLASGSVTAVALVLFAATMATGRKAPPQRTASR
ncbi:hypothetical protein ASC89_22035 [Devosia sp. Root413D1]|nr:hypothetical protein ASC89_22035 [Devosia sp. Root413D1]